MKDFDTGNIRSFKGKFKENRSQIQAAGYSEVILIVRTLKFGPDDIMALEWVIEDFIGNTVKKVAVCAKGSWVTTTNEQWVDGAL